MQEKTLADEPARIVSKVYEKPCGSRGLEGNDCGDHISLKFSNTGILKRSYKELLTVEYYTLEKKKKG